MSGTNYADWISALGQATEAVVVVLAFIFAKGEVKSLIAQRQLGHDETRANAAANVWDTVVQAADVVESLNAQPIRKGGTPAIVEEHCAARTALIRPAVEGVNRSIGRAELLLGDTDINAELKYLSDVLFAYAKRIEKVPSLPQEDVELVSKDEVAKAEATKNTIHRKLHGVALRIKAPPVT